MYNSYDDDDDDVDDDNDDDGSGMRIELYYLSIW